MAFGIIGFVLWFVFLVLGIVVAMDAKRAGRQGWWVYLVCAFFLVPAIIAVLFWTFHAKRRPVQISDGFAV